jgi:acetylornithine deacetylase
MTDVVQRLQRYVATRSLSKQEDALADLVCADLREAGLTPEREGNNVWCTVGDASRPRLLLNSHLDTVPPGDGWSRDPWTPTRIDNRIYGLGANDAKGCGVGMLTATLALKAAIDRGERIGGTVVLALTAEEENTGAGLGTVLDRLRPLDAALVGEPTELVPMIAQRGLLILRGVARGRTSHPANTPGTDTNAIYAAAAAIQRIRDFDWGPVHLQLGRPHAHVTLIQGGVARNVVPDQCEFFVDIRTTPLESHESLYERLAAAIAPCELHIHSKRLTPIDTPADAAIVRAVCTALPGAKPAGSPAMSDMVFLSGIPSVKIGPGSSPRSHTPDEFIGADELEAGAAAYERIARAYFALFEREQTGCRQGATR